MTSAVELMNEARRDIFNVYADKSIEGDFSISCSWGKDSTTVVKLFLEQLMLMPAEDRTRKVHIICSDTMVENPLVHMHVLTEMDKCREFVEKHELPVELHLVHRPVKDGYFAKTVGTGTRLPDNKQRYCTVNLKLNPQKQIKNKIKPKIVFNGVRKSESQRRSTTYTEKFEQDRQMKGTTLFYPILDFTVEDVWDALAAPLPWGSSLGVRMLYREATGECGFQNPKGTEKHKVDACGARFGCWVCPVVQADKSLLEMIKFHPWLKPLNDWAVFHMILWGQYVPPADKTMPRKERSAQLRLWEDVVYEVRLLSKTGHDRKGRKMFEKIKHETEVPGSVRKQKKVKKKNEQGKLVETIEVWYETQGDFRPDWGCMSTEARRFALKKLLEAQEEMNELRADEGLPYYELIHQDELDYIERVIAEDEVKRPWLSTGRTDIERQFHDAIKQMHEKHGQVYDAL